MNSVTSEKYEISNRGSDLKLNLRLSASHEIYGRLDLLMYSARCKMIIFSHNMLVSQLVGSGMFNNLTIPNL